MRSIPAAQPNTLTMSAATRTDRTDEYESRHRYSMLHNEPYSYLSIEKPSSSDTEVRVYLPRGDKYKSDSMYERDSEDWIREHFVENHQDTRGMSFGNPTRGGVLRWNRCRLPSPTKINDPFCPLNSTEGVKQELCDQVLEGDMREWFTNFMGPGADDSFQVSMHTVIPLFNRANSKSQE